ncbi:MAG: hypothetical protein WA985_10460 [Erythrobacter sp.]
MTGTVEISLEEFQFLRELFGRNRNAALPPPRPRNVAFVRALVDREVLYYVEAALLWSAFGADFSLRFTEKGWLTYWSMLKENGDVVR